MRFHVTLGATRVLFVAAVCFVASSAGCGGSSPASSGTAGRGGTNGSAGAGGAAGGSAGGAGGAAGAAAGSAGGGAGAAGGAGNIDASPDLASSADAGVVDAATGGDSALDVSTTVTFNGPIALPNGAAPLGLAGNSTTNRVYVGLQGTNNEGAGIAVFDGTSANLLATVTLPTGADAGTNQPLASLFAVDETANLVYAVSNLGTLRTGPPLDLWVIDGSTNTVTATIPLAQPANALALDPVNHKLYVGGEPWSGNPGTAAGFQVIDTTNNTAGSLITVSDMQAINAMAVDTKTNLLFLCGGQATTSFIGTAAVDQYSTTTVTANAAQRLFAGHTSSDIVDCQGAPGFAVMGLGFNNPFASPDPSSIELLEPRSIPLTGQRLLGYRSTGGQINGPSMFGPVNFLRTILKDDPDAGGAFKAATFAFCDEKLIGHSVPEQVIKTPLDPEFTWVMQSEAGQLMWVVSKYDSYDGGTATNVGVFTYQLPGLRSEGTDSSPCCVPLGYTCAAGATCCFGTCGKGDFSSTEDYCH